MRGLVLIFSVVHVYETRHCCLYAPEIVLCVCVILSRAMWLCDTFQCAQHVFLHDCIIHVEAGYHSDGHTTQSYSSRIQKKSNAYTIS